MDKLANKIIDALGGTSAVAVLCEIKPPSVCRWRQTGIPSARLMYLRAVRPKVVRAAEKAMQVGKRR